LLPAVAAAARCGDGAATYPVEEVVFATAAVAAADARAFTYLGRVQWAGGDMRFSADEVAAIKADDLGPLFVKRVPRDADDAFVKLVMANV